MALYSHQQQGEHRDNAPNFHKWLAHAAEKTRKMMRTGRAYT